ncbi:hypothetical protein PVK06_012021 [Gossypium arboreum]|uniref:Uncharacterized protein n=1 Tax=Gossypium arboreum TaxID=29729 RepID=A0ABR0QAD1_GOSAR|nr:hypothetical protein PVK06_012021 [Gossypium arboreum]
MVKHHGSVVGYLDAKNGDETSKLDRSGTRVCRRCQEESGCEPLEIKEPTTMAHLCDPSCSKDVIWPSWTGPLLGEIESPSRKHGKYGM